MTCGGAASRLPRRRLITIATTPVVIHQSRRTTRRTSPGRVIKVGFRAIAVLSLPSHRLRQGDSAELLQVIAESGEVVAGTTERDIPVGAHQVLSAILGSKDAQCPAPDVAENSRR